MDFALLYGEVYMAERHDAGEDFGDIAHFQQRHLLFACSRLLHDRARAF